MNNETISTIVKEKPFTVNIDEVDDTEAVQATGTRLVRRERPFTTKDTPDKKLYLVLKYYNSKVDNEENYRSFEFYKGTSQDLYDHLKNDIITNDELDIMRSRVLVDSPTVTISRKCTIYMFMRDMRNSGRITDDTSFDIDDYKYDESDAGLEDI